MFWWNYQKVAGWKIVQLHMLMEIISEFRLCEIFCEILKKNAMKYFHLINITSLEDFTYRESWNNGPWFANLSNTILIQRKDIPPPEWITYYKFCWEVTSKHANYLTINSCSLDWNISWKMKSYIFKGSLQTSFLWSWPDLII